MKKHPLFLICTFLFAIVLNVPAYAESEEDKLLARYGQYGGPFELTDHTGRTRTDEDFIGQYVLLFFGYTYCPDVCPTTMQIIADTMEELGDGGARFVQPLFISVDPERDTPESLADFISHFHPKIIGLTGSKENILTAADHYGASFVKVFTPPTIGSGEDVDPKKDYLINHSAATYLMGPDGKFITYFPFGVTTEEMTKGIRAAFP